MRVLIAGCGYVGRALGRNLAASGHQVFGVNRSGQPASELAAAGILPVRADLSDLGSFRNFPKNCDWLVFCAATSGGGPDAYQKTYFDGMANLLQWARASGSPIKKFVYTSSTSIYAQTDGSWADETTEPAPDPETSRILLATEKLLIDATRLDFVPGIVLRLAGIYGPGRGYWLQQFLEDKITFTKSEERFLNMVHLEDIVRVIELVLAKGLGGKTYNVVDDQPVLLSEVLEWLVERTGRPLAANSAEQTLPRKRGVSNKKVSNQKLKIELGYKFKFPTFREGFTEELSYFPPGPSADPKG